MQTRGALKLLAITLTGLTMVSLSDASADKVKGKELYGIASRAVSIQSVTETISNCGDSDPNTNVVLTTNTGTVSYTGFMEGTGQVLTTTLSNACVSGQTHRGIRVLDIFESLTVADRTGGAVVEIVGSGRVPAPGVNLNDNGVRILCGTGQLKGVHAEGTLTASMGPGVDSRPMQVWVHFGHHHDVGFDFLCRNLPHHDSDD